MINLSVIPGPAKPEPGIQENRGSDRYGSVIPPSDVFLDSGFVAVRRPGMTTKGWLG